MGLWCMLLGTGVVARLLSGDGRGLAYWFLLCKPSNFQVEGPHSKQLCTIRAVFLIGIVGLLDYC